MSYQNKQIKTWLAMIAALAAAAAIMVGVTGCGNTDSASGNSGSDDAAAVEDEGQTITATEGDEADANADADADETADAEASSDMESASKLNQDISSAIENPEDSKGSLNSFTSSTQEIGNQKTGYVTVPGTWEDRVSDYDERTVEDTAMAYYVDPATEYTSGALGHFAFADSIMMRVYPTSYEEITDSVLAGYEGDSMFGDTDSGQYAMGTRNCYLVTTSIPEDGVYICNLIIDRDNDGHACVLMTITGTPSSIESVLAYAATWTY